MLPSMSFGVPCISADSVQMKERIVIDENQSDKDKLRMREENSSVSKPLLRLFNALTQKKLEMFIEHSEMF